MKRAKDTAIKPILASEALPIYGNLRGLKLRMTEEEFVNWSETVDETIHAEWVAGEVIMMTPDNLEHNDTEGLIYRVFTEFVNIKGLGRVFHGHVQVRLPVKPSRRDPDILFVSKRRLHLLKKNYIDGAPDLAMEIVSPSSGERDFRIKYHEYEEAGVREYWIIEPMTRAISVYVLNSKDRYESVPEKHEKFPSKVVPGFYLRQAWLTDIQSVRLIDVLKEMGI